METMKNFFQNVFMLLMFQYRRLFRTWTSWFIFLGPIGLLLMTAFVIPPENLMYLIIGAGVASSTFFQFGTTFREWKHNNLIRANMKFTNYGILVGFFAFFLFSTIIAISAVLFCLGLSYLFFETIGLHPISGEFWQFDWGGNFLYCFFKYFSFSFCGLFFRSYHQNISFLFAFKCVLFTVDHFWRRFYEYNEWGTCTKLRRKQFNFLSAYDSSLIH